MNPTTHFKTKQTAKQKLFRWIKVLLFLYAAIGIGLYYLQELFLFHPQKLPKNFVYNFNVPFEEINIPFNEKDTVNLVKFFPKDSVRKGVVLYFHGNKENIIRYAKFTDIFTQKGYEVWVEDYPTFGKSTGEITEKKLYNQAIAIRKMAGSKYDSNKIIVYGKSLGTGIAAFVAANTHNQQLILETPYYSIADLFSCYAPIYPTNRMATFKIPTYSYVSQVSYPITIFHGTNDWVVPYRCAKKLKTVLKQTDQFITLADGTHHNLSTFTQYKNTIDSLLQLY
jgi:uncharacterized protein